MTMFLFHIQLIVINSLEMFLLTQSKNSNGEYEEYTQEFHCVVVPPDLQQYLKK